MNTMYIKKIELIKELRKYFEDLGAIEVFTPVSRKTCADIISRVPAGEGRFLRNCQESYMRLFTPVYGNVFEIGPSFRPEESEDTTHGIEFMLLEAQFMHKDLSFLMTLLKGFIEMKRKDFHCEKISVYQIIKERTGIDLINEGEEKLIEFLQNKYPKFFYKQNYELVNLYISNEIEPLSKNRCIFFYEYPACTLSLARYCEKTKEIVQRFELFINGIEVSNGYVYSDNIEEYIYRNKKVNLFTTEEEYLAEQFKSGVISMDACVVGIGIERLCMVLNDLKDIRVILRENEVF